MTIRGVGKPVPSQLNLLRLAGLVTERRARVENPTAEQVEQSRREGYERLKELTGEDFGFDVQAWFRHLMTHAGYGLTHPYGYQAMRRILRELGHEVPFKKDVDPEAR